MRLHVMVAVMWMTVAMASTARAQEPHSRGWLDVNFGIASAAEKSFAMHATETQFDEPAHVDATYHLPTGASFDFGGGVMITPRVGIGVSYTGTAHQDVVSLHISIPHPFFFNAYADDTTPTASKLMRVEGGSNIQLMFVAYDRRGVRVRVFGGPSFFRVQQDAVDEVDYNQDYLVFSPVNSVSITTFTQRQVEGTGWGGHVGADVSYFFTHVVGVGGFARFTRGSVDIENTLAGGGTVTVKAGGVQAGGGLRLRF